MLKNYFKIAWRNLLRSKSHASINIIGLVIGMSVALVISLWIWDEVSFDDCHLNHARLAQVMDSQTYNGETSTGMEVAVPLAEELRTKFGGDIKKAALTSWNFAHILSVGDIKISQSGIWAQPGLPSMLTLDMLEGGTETFKDPSSMLISQSVAKALFGDADPMGRIVRVDNNINLKVAGVYKDLPLNSSFYDTKYLMAWDNAAYAGNKLASDWNQHGFLLYVQMGDRADFRTTTAKIKGIAKPHRKDGNEEVMLHPMDRWHLYNEFSNGKEAGGRIQVIWLFGIIGGFVLLLACINFMNLSTARSEKRSMEVGVRKAIGSMRSELIWQFLSESLLVAALAMMFALILVQLSLPLFNDMANKDMTVPWGNSFFWLFALCFTLFTGFVSGSYPAFYLSSFNPVSVLKGTFRAGRFASLPRRVLVVAQFAVSTSLIIGTIVIFRQVEYAKDRAAGYDRDRLLTVVMNTPEIYSANYNALRDDLIRTGAVEDMAESSSAPTEIENSLSGFDWKGKDPYSDPSFGAISVTHDFGRTIRWKLSAGRDFSRDFPLDSNAVILNESAAQLTGMNKPVGEIIKLNNKKLVIAGVVKDMIMQSPYKPPKPTIFFLNYGLVNFVTVRVNQGMPMPEALAKIGPVFKKYNPGSPFSYKFTDEEYARKFSDEQRIGKISALFAILAIFISCLGLSGLASFVAEQRTKEIGVRKVLGATVFDLWGLISKEFAALVSISLLIAIPVSYYFMHSWLQGYQYRTTISWWIFAAVGSGALIITLLTISIQTIRAAIASPVKSLRSE